MPDSALETKRCTKCGAEKPLTEFNKGKGPGGRVSRCKACRRAARCEARPPGKRTLRSVEHLEILEALRASAQPGCKVCTQCLTVKPLDDFWNHSKCADGKQNRCKECIREDHKKKGWQRRLRWQYGITISDYTRLLESQGWCCAICRTVESGTKSGRFVVDHDHKTGKVRGLLCSDCNCGLGLYRDNPDYLVSAAQYLVEASL